MNLIKTDIAIIGAGFGGSLTALILNRIDLETVLFERDVHPRFAIGESSTPIADLVLAALAREYDLPRLLPLTKYGAWRAAYPDLPCGLKRGFSYFQHRAGQPFAPDPAHRNELLVAANPSEAEADTHWYRAAFDAFLVGEVQAAGVEYHDRTEITNVEIGSPCLLTGVRAGREIRIEAAFVVDASGPDGPMVRSLSIPTVPDGIFTHSRTLFAHFTGVRPWHDVYRDLGGVAADHPFRCDDAALHHVFDGGWMWVLRFDTGITSAGFVLDSTRRPLDPSVSARDEWAALLKRYPSIAAQFEDARLVPEFDAPMRTGRLQRVAARMVGENWAMLPSAACFIDPLHSSGNAHTLCAIERLVRILKEGWGRPELGERLTAYEQTIRREIALMDRIIHGCYESFDCFDLMAAFAMFYFAGATYSEHRRRAGRTSPDDAFLAAHDPRLADAVSSTHAELLRMKRAGAVGEAESRAFKQRVARAIEPFNVAGLCDDARRNMYPFG